MYTHHLKQSTYLLTATFDSGLEQDVAALDVSVDHGRLQGMEVGQRLSYVQKYSHLVGGIQRIYEYGGSKCRKWRQ
jgi:hypothetical protein